MNNADFTNILPSYLSPFFTASFIVLFFQLFSAGLVVTVLAYLLLRFIQLRMTLAKQYVLLEVKPVYKTLQSPLSTKQLFTVLHSIEQHSSLTEKLLGIKQTVSCELVSTKEEGIRYIIRVPDDYVSLLKKTLLAYLPGVEIKEVSDYFPNTFASLPSGKYFLAQELKLFKPFVLPLAPQEQLNQYDPISYLTAHMTKQSNDEIIALQIVHAPVLTRTHKGIINYTRKLKGLLMAGEDISKELYRGHFHSLYNALVFMVRGEIKKPAISTSKRELHSSIEGKINEPLFETTIRLFCVADSQTSARARAKGIRSSFDTFTTPHQSIIVKHRILTRLRSSVLDKLRYFNLKNRLLALTDNSILSVSELSSLYHLPYTATTKTEDLINVRSPKLPSPLPLKSSFNNLDLVFAHNTYGETTVPIGLTLEERRRHVYIIGATGTGKTTALLHMIHHDLLKGSGVAIIDPHGDLIQRLLGVIPKERLEDVVYFNPYDIERPVGLNILELSDNLSEVETQREKDMIASSMISIFHKLYPPRYTGPRMEHILRNTVLTALELEKPTLLTVQKLLTNIDFRKKIVATLPKGVLKDFWNDEFGKLGSFQKAEQISPITNKLGRFLTTSITRNILTQPESKLDFTDIMNNKKILLCDLSKGRIGEDTSSFLGSLIVAKIQLAALKRVDVAEKLRTDFFLYIDEFQNFATPSFAQILSEARKYRLNTILAHQTISQIEDKDLLKVILANVGSIISFRTSNPTDEDMMLPLFAPQVEKHEISNLPSYHFYMKINAIEPQNAFTGEINDFVVDDGQVTRESVINISREAYGVKSETKRSNNVKSLNTTESSQNDSDHPSTRALS